MHIFPLIVLPFKDLEGVFESSTNAVYAYHFFGLKFNTKKAIKKH